MLASGAIGTAGFVIDPETHTIRLVRRIDAPPAHVFRAWTKPDEVACWWDPTGEPLASCEIDLRPGGSFLFASRSHPGMPFSGVYREIAPPERLVFEAMGATGRVLLEQAGSGTYMVVEIACASKDHLDQFVQMGVAAGTSQTLDNLMNFVAEPAGAAV